MKTTEREMWVHVTSEAELRAGDVIRIANPTPARTYMILRRAGARHCDKCHAECVGWMTNVAPPRGYFPEVCVATPIRRAALFRLETNLDASEENPYLAKLPTKQPERAR